MYKSWGHSKLVETWKAFGILRIWDFSAFSTFNGFWITVEKSYFTTVIPALKIPYFSPEHIDSKQELNRTVYLPLWANSNKKTTSLFRSTPILIKVALSGVLFLCPSFWGWGIFDDSVIYSVGSSGPNAENHCFKLFYGLNNHFNLVDRNLILHRWFCYELSGVDPTSFST